MPLLAKRLDRETISEVYWEYKPVTDARALVNCHQLLCEDNSPIGSEYFSILVRAEQLAVERIALLAPLSTGHVMTSFEIETDMVEEPIIAMGRRQH